MDGLLEHYITAMVRRNDPDELALWKQACAVAYGVPAGTAVRPKCFATHTGV